MNLTTFHTREECVKHFDDYHGAKLVGECTLEKWLWFCRDSDRDEPGYTFNWFVEYGNPKGEELIGFKWPLNEQLRNIIS